MAVNEKMYNELCRCRQDIKEIIKKKTGKAPSVMETIKEFEKNLVNVIRRNRLLYTPKVVNKYAFVERMLSGKKRRGDNRHYYV